MPAGLAIFTCLAIGLLVWIASFYITVLAWRAWHKPAEIKGPGVVISGLSFTSNTVVFGNNNNWILWHQAATNP